MLQDLALTAPLFNQDHTALVSVHAGSLVPNIQAYADGFAIKARELGLDWTADTFRGEDGNLRHDYLRDAQHAKGGDKPLDSYIASFDHWLAQRAECLFGRYAMALAIMGLSPVSVITAAKATAQNSFQNLAYRRQSVPELTAAMEKHATRSIGHVCGFGDVDPEFATMGIDVDQPHHVEAVARALATVAGMHPDDLPARYRVNSGKVLFPIRLGLAGVHNPGKMKFGYGATQKDSPNDLIGERAYFVLMGMHPSGVPYRTRNYDPLTDSVERWPLLTAEGLAQVFREAGRAASWDGERDAALWLEKSTNAPVPAEIKTRIGYKPLKQTRAPTIGYDGDFMDVLHKAALANLDAWAKDLPGLTFTGVDSDGGWRFTPNFRGSKAVNRGSLTINPGRGSIFDHSAGEGYTAHGLIIEATGRSFQSVKRELAAKLGLAAACEADDAAFRHATRAGRIVADYEAERQRIEAQEAAEPVDHAEALDTARVQTREASKTFMATVVADAPTQPRLVNPAPLPALDENGDAPEAEPSDDDAIEDDAPRYEHVRHPVTVLDVGAGVGKTSAVVSDIAEAIRTPGAIKRALIFAALNHPNQDGVARDLREKIGPGAKVTIQRTRDKSNCPRFESEIRPALRGDPDLKVSQAFCFDRASGERCRFFDECGFQKARRDAKEDPAGRVVVVTHAALFGFPENLPDDVQGTIVDEDPSSEATKETRKALFGDLVNACFEADANPLCADQKLSLNQFPRMMRQALESVTGETILDSTWFDAAMLDPAMLRDLVKAFQTMAGRRSAITPLMDSVKRAHAIKHNAGVSLWESRAKIIEAMRVTAKSLKRAADLTLTATPAKGDFQLVVFARKRIPDYIARRPIAVLDGTANLQRIAAAVGPTGEQIVAHPPVDPSFVHVEFLAGAPVNKKDLLAKDSTALAGHHREILALHKRVKGDVLVTGPDTVLKALAALGLPTGVATLNSARAIGTNEHEDVAGLYVLAQERPDHRVLENRALALAGRVERLPATAEFWQSQTHMRIARDGQPYTVETYEHPDPLVLALLDRACVNAIEQGVARARPLNRPAEGKSLVVVLACVTVPERIRVDTVRSWAEGAGGLASVMTQRHGGVVIGSDLLVAALFPDIFGKECTKEALKAVENHKAAHGWPGVEAEISRSTNPESIYNPYSQGWCPCYFVTTASMVKTGKAAVWIDRSGRTADEVAALFAEHGQTVTVTPYTADKDRQSSAWETIGLATNSPAASFHLGRQNGTWQNLDAAKNDAKAGRLADARAFVASTTGARSFGFMMRPEGAKRAFRVEVAVNPALHSDPVAAIRAAFPVAGELVETTTPTEKAPQTAQELLGVVIPFPSPASLPQPALGVAGGMLAGWRPPANDPSPDSYPWGHGAMPPPGEIERTRRAMSFR